MARKKRGTQKKPECTKGQSCGFSCISQGDSCNAKVKKGFLSNLLDKFARALGFKKDAPNGETTGADQEPADKDVPENKKLTKGSIASTVPSITEAKINKALFDLEDPSNEANFDRFRKLYEAANLTSAIYKTDERGSGRKVKAKAKEVFSALKIEEKLTLSADEMDLDMLTVPKGSWGITNGLRHIPVRVVKANKKDDFNPDVDALKSRMKNQLESHMNEAPSRKLFTLGDDPDVKVKDTPDEQLIQTLIHELGHKIHFEASLLEFGEGDSTPDDITGEEFGERYDLANGVGRYSRTNDMEFFAEHFTAWLIAPDELKEANDDIFNHIEDVMRTAEDELDLL